MKNNLVNKITKASNNEEERNSSERKVRQNQYGYWLIEVLQTKDLTS